MSNYAVNIFENGGTIKMWHTKIVNPLTMYRTTNTNQNGSITYAENCEFTQNYRNSDFRHRYLDGGLVRNNWYPSPYLKFTLAKDCAFYRYGDGDSYAGLNGRFENCIFVDWSGIPWVTLQENMTLRWLVPVTQALKPLLRHPNWDVVR